MADGKKQLPESEQDAGVIGSVHVMPTAYQGGKMPESLSAPQVSLSSKPKTSSPPLKQELPKTLPASPIKPVLSNVPLNPLHRSLKKTMILVTGIVAFVALGALLIVWFLTPKPVPVVVAPTPNPFPTIIQEPILEPDPEPIPEPVPESIPKEILPGRDTDSDGLADVEEQLYGSNVRLPDTDEDGFLDGNEVYHGYAPALPAPATLLDKNLTVLVGDPVLPGLVVPSPVSWEVSRDTVNASFALVARTGEQIIFRTYPKEVSSTLQDWLLVHPEIANDGPYLSIFTPSRLSVRTSQDKRHAFIELKDQILEAVYDLSGRETVEYLQTFQYVVGHAQAQEDPTRL